MSSNLNIQREYSILYFPPKSEAAGNRAFLITILSLIFCIAIVPILLISIAKVNEVISFLIGGGGATAFFLFVIQPRLLQNSGERTEILIGPNAVKIRYSDQRESIHLLEECTFSCYEHSGSDEADIAWIKVRFKDDTEFVIKRKFALKGDFEVLLKETKKQTGVK